MTAISEAPGESVTGPALAVSGLDIEIASNAGRFLVVADMTFSVAPGETLCIVGESGCGKSMTALSLMRLLPDAARVRSGRIMLDDEDILALDEHTVEDYRGDRIAMIFQEPLTAFNPVLRVGEQIAEAVRQHRRISHRRAFARAIEALRLVQMPDPEQRARQYPHELSGGMRQRAMIALALACDPQVIVADEPTTALDVTIQAQILGLVSDLQTRLGTAQILITHDLSVVAEVADRVVVMYAGRRVEEADVYSLFDEPLHPYTRGLMGAVPRRGVRGGEPLAEIGGTVPPPWNMPQGCAFAPRCPLATEQCRRERPPLEYKRPGHTAACWEVVPENV